MWIMEHRSRALCAVLVCSMMRIALAQPYWVRHVGSLGNDHISDVKTDAAGYIYITGEFSGTADFEQETLFSGGGLDFFVAKLDPDGNVIWWKQGGGYGLDRGIKLALGPNNTMAVVGEFMGSATFQGVTITSNDFTADMFVMRLDRTTGAQQWIRQGGGGEGADRPYGVTIAPNGQVTVAGEFKGTALWDGFTLSSIPDPETLIPTMDVVVVSYDMNGTALWVQQGAADHTDRAIDVVNDAQGNIYVAGQFSDTITFDVEHLNAMYNATFLLKLDPAGNEQWFRRCGGAIYDHVRDLLYTPDGELLLVGDLQGNMIFLDDSPDMINGEQDFNYYLLRVSTDGQFIASGQIGSDNGLSVRGVDLFNDTIAVVGQFNCQFTSMAGYYGGTGLFMAAGSEDIFLNKHRYTDLGFIAARHYGGPGSKLAGQVAILPDGDPVMCGSYTRSISFAGNWNAEIGTDYFTNWMDTYASSPDWSCPDQSDLVYYSQDARGLKDGLLARTWTEDSVLYDWFNRYDSDCDHPAIMTMCLREQNDYGAGCPDTTVVCGEAHLYAELPFPPSYDTPSGEEVNTTGALVHVLWNTGDTTFSLTTQSTGWYSVLVDAANGCWSWHDSLYVIVHPMPPEPQVSDDVVVNTDEIYPQTVLLCDPDSALVWCSNIDNSTTWYWSHYSNDTLPPDTLFNESFIADTTGYWWFTMTTDHGCTETTSIQIIDHDVPVLDDYDLDIVVTFPADTLGIDSVWLCQNSYLQYQMQAWWTLAWDTVALPSDLYLYVNFNHGGWSYLSVHDQWSGITSDFGPGWNTFDIDVKVTNGSCGEDSLLFHFTEDLWIGIWPSIPVSVQMSGPSTMCVGDSAMLVATCANCTTFDWSGPGVYNDTTAQAWANAEGYFTVYGYAVDTNGCSYGSYDSQTINYPPGPLLLVDPAGGIICPDDSAHIYTTTPGTDQIWYTPYGPVPNNSQHHWDWVAGEYYLTMTDLQGCFLTSDPVLLTGYGTPYLNVSPDNILCLVDDEVLIQVITTVPSSIVWGSPLSGSALEQVITQPGTYTVTSTACGITTTLSATIVGSDVHAEVVDPGPFAVCPGDTVFLEAVQGAAIYVWQPGNVYAEVFAATEPGEYVLQAIDGSGCIDESEPVVVDWYDFAQPLTVHGDTICPGAEATLTAAGSGVITWYSDPLGQNPLTTGTSYLVSGLVSDTVFYAQQSDNTCSGQFVPVPVVVLQIGAEIVFTGPDEACSGGSATFTAFTDNATQYDWVTPGGTAPGPTLTIDPVSTTDAGVYICTATAEGCGSVTGSFTFNVVASVPLGLGADVSLCDGDTAVFTLASGFTDIIWNGAPGGNSYATWLEGSVIVQATDPGGCPGADTVLVDQFQFSTQLQAQNLAICAGEDAVLNAGGSGMVQWSTSPDMDPVVFTGNPMTLSQPQSGSTWYINQTEGDCTSDVVSVQLTVDPVPVGVAIDAPLFTCAEDTLVITLTGPLDFDAWWMTPTGSTWGTTLTIPGFGPDDAGTYVAVPYIGNCTGDTLSVEVAFQEPILFSLGPDTTYCIGASVQLSIPPTYSGPIWSTGDTTWNIAVSSDGTYFANAQDENGCDVQDAITLIGEDCAPVVPNFITPNGDGVNDSWHLDPARGGFRSAELLVFDRFGRQVFHGDPSLTDFRGENDTGEPLSEGVYFYVLRLIRVDDTVIEREGYVHVNR